MARSADIKVEQMRNGVMKREKAERKKHHCRFAMEYVKIQ